MKILNSLAAILLIALVAAPLSAQTKTAPKKSAAPPKSAAPYNAALLKPATLTAKAPDTYEVKFVTTKGDFTVKVTRDWAPLGADRFYNLVKHGFYNDASLFRMVTGFVVQFGISAYPQVSAAWLNARIADDPVKEHNTVGRITFATSGRDSRTTQVFINLGDNSRLDGMGFAPFGEVTEGMDVVTQLYSGYREAPTSKQGEIANGGKAYLEKEFPKLDSIKTATIVGAPAEAPAAPAKKAPVKKAPAKKTPAKTPPPPKS